MPTTIEEYQYRIKIEQASKSALRRDRDRYKQLFEEMKQENIKLQAIIDDETNREWSPVWCRDKLAAAQIENEKLKKYIMALEEGKEFIVRG